jgi:predicted nucleic acid-binding Zn ribbon protein
VRRSAPRPLSLALERLARKAEPATPLARVQQRWAAAVGEQLAHEAEPVSERDGIVTVACGSAVWAQELELLSNELLERLEAALGPSDEGRVVRRLRFVTRPGAGRS